MFQSYSSRKISMDMQEDFFLVRGWVGGLGYEPYFECFPSTVGTIRGLLIFCWARVLLIRVEEVLKTLIWVGEFSVWNK